LVQQKELFQGENLRKAHQSTPKRFNPDRAIEELVGVFSDPIIVWPLGGWQETIPDWLKERVPLDRLLEQMKQLKGEEPTATDTEALIYMYPLSLERPMDHDWTQIYMYLATKVCGAEGKLVPDDIRVETLNKEQERDLKRLKDWIYESRRRRRIEKAADIRRERIETAAQESREKYGEQSSLLFDF
jgi:hypothetical protein